MPELESLVAIGVSVVSLAVTLYGVGYKMGRNDTKIDALWEIFMKNAVHFTTRDGAVQHHSPLEVDEAKVKELLSEDLVSRIRKFNGAKSPKDKVYHWAMVEKTFGPELEKIGYEKNVPYRTLITVATNL